MYLSVQRGMMSPLKNIPPFSEGLIPQIYRYIPECQYLFVEG